MKQVVASINVVGITDVNFQAGRNIQILKSLTEFDDTISLKGLKYPLIAMILPIPEQRGISAIYYCKIKIPRIVFAQIVEDPDGLSPIDDRYSDDAPLKKVLYPLYYEFLDRLAQHLNVVGEDPEMFSHTKIDNPGTQPISKGLNDYIDSIEILNLELTLSQFKTC